jgi:integrase/recombinase XerC
MEREIAEFLAYKAAERGLTPRTIEAYRHDLAKFGQFVAKETGSKPAIADIDQYTIKAYLQFLANAGIKKINASVTRGRKLATLKSFFKYLESEGKVKTDPASQIKMPKSKRKEPSYLTEQEYKRLLRAVQKNATKYFKLRDTAIVNLFLGMGLRLSELVELNVGSVNFEDGVIKVSRKGNQERILPANDDVMVTLQRYLKSRKDTPYASPLFLSKRDQRIDSATVWYLVKKYLKQAQIEKDKLSPHTLRHTFATTLLKQGVNILAIKELLSHRNLRTTERYLHITGEDLKIAVGKIDLSSKN